MCDILLTRDWFSRQPLQYYAYSGHRHTPLIHFTECHREALYCLALDVGVRQGLTHYLCFLQLQEIERSSTISCRSYPFLLRMPVDWSCHHLSMSIFRAKREPIILLSKGCMQRHRDDVPWTLPQGRSANERVKNLPSHRFVPLLWKEYCFPQPPAATEAANPGMHIKLIYSPSKNYRHEENQQHLRNLRLPR